MKKKTPKFFQTQWLLDQIPIFMKFSFTLSCRLQQFSSKLEEKEKCWQFNNKTKSTVGKVKSLHIKSINNNTSKVMNGISCARRHAKDGNDLEHDLYTT
ncbi:CLUMA_CG004211, isoform A [Clunio marinus]|uniref:CLUMA_CG004211, isoform A n=1 Tax=Clunio marinus TaxID=568069 RepID=A0A1J1HR10_9DIPT|nr:CLUMA_CG004211, isoform A [Clunio marinus]